MIPLHVIGTKMLCPPANFTDNYEYEVRTPPLIRTLRYACPQLNSYTMYIIHVYIIIFIIIKYLRNEDTP